MSLYIHQNISKELSEFENHKLSRSECVRLLVDLGESELTACMRFSNIHKVNV